MSIFDFAYEWQRLNETLEEQHAAISAMRESGARFAEAKRDYRIALAQKMAELRFDKSYPVTLVPDLARGNAEVAALGYEREKAHAEFEADRSLCEYLKNKTWIIQRHIEMEAKGL